MAHSSSPTRTAWACPAPSGADYSILVPDCPSCTEVAASAAALGAERTSAAGEGQPVQPCNNQDANIAVEEGLAKKAGRREGRYLRNAVS